MFNSLKHFVSTRKKSSLTVLYQYHKKISTARLNIHLEKKAFLQNKNITYKKTTIAGLKYDKIA